MKLRLYWPRPAALEAAWTPPTAHQLPSDPSERRDVMMTRLRVVTAGLAFAALAISELHGTTAAAVEGLDPDALAALAKLYETMPAAKVLGEQAKGILVFPSIGRAGFLIGVQYGEGALFQSDQIVGYYNVAGASYGLQAG